ncbi:2OG-Fe(II) oxygenase [Gilvimarinus japonicus]|uniref:2OG-Fe(II) oxygenase n=1 Tax=Gilvimarinus japonicus TaxID=1796469 RepID=A0ABV7HR83_9GAMM
MKIINPDVVAQASLLREKFASAKPFGHVVIDNFLQPELCETVLQQFPSFDERLAMNENGHVGRKAVNEKVASLGSAYQELDKLASSDEFRTFVGQITGLDNLLYDPYYFGGGSHENLSGQGLDVHVDFTHHPVTNWHRRLNLIIYLNHDWDPAWGGNIELHKNPRLPPEQDEVVTVPPVFNRAVLFETHNSSWHGFKKVRLPDEESDRSRKSFALYYYTDDREQKVRPHSTIYVEEHVDPEITAPGHTLSATDSQTIRDHVMTRDHHLGRLYNNITDLMGQLQDAREYIQHLQQFEVKFEALQREQVAAPPQTLPASDDALNQAPPPMAANTEADIAAQLALASSREQALRQQLSAIENARLWKVSQPLRRLIDRMRG